jgi:phospholipid/cholesterol/gamma-HCH transport system substrate-binding protein
MLTGAIALLLLMSTITVGVKAAFGAYAGGYRVSGTFDAAGQGLLPGSDVKVRGVNVGSVRKIQLVDGAAQVTMRLHSDQKVPKDVIARIRAKTLFGEKFVDLDLTKADEVTGPFLQNGDRITHTEGGFELESVLTDLYPLLKAIDPTELMTVISNLADGGRGLGENINRTLVNSAKVSDVFAKHDADTAKFLHDFALVSGQLAKSADDLVGIATAGNQVLPILNDHEADLVTILQQTGRLSNDVADVLLNNRPFVDASLGGGSKALQILYDRRTQVVPLVIALREYVQTLSEVIRINVGDGTLMGAVKAVVGSQVCGVLPCPGGPGNTATAATAATNGTASGTTKATTGAPLLLKPDQQPSSGSNGVSDLLRRVLGA